MCDRVFDLGRASLNTCLLLFHIILRVQCSKVKEKSGDGKWVGCGGTAARMFGTLRMKQKSSQPSSGVRHRKKGKDSAEGMDLNAPLIVYEERNCPSGG